MKDWHSAGNWLASRNGGDELQDHKMNRDDFQRQSLLRRYEKGCAGQASLWRVGATTNIRIGFGVSMGFGLPVWICFRSGGQRDILSELQDGAGFNLCHCVQGEQAEDEDKGGVRVSVAVAYILKIYLGAWDMSSRE